MWFGRSSEVFRRWLGRAFRSGADSLAEVKGKWFPAFRADFGCDSAGALLFAIWASRRLKNYQYQYRKAKTEPKFSTSTGNNSWEISGIF